MDDDDIEDLLAKKFIPISEKEQHIEDNENLHQYATYIADNEDDFSTTFDEELQPSIKYSKISGSEPKSKPVFQSKVSFNKNCKTDELKELENYGRFKKTPSYIKNNRQAFDYFYLTRKVNLKHDAKNNPAAMLSKIQIQKDIEQDKFEQDGQQLLWASPTSSDHSELHQIEGVLALRNARTGIFLNETLTASELPFHNYDPRVLEKYLDSGPPYDIKQVHNGLFVKVPDYEYIPVNSELDFIPSIPYICPTKTYSIPCKDYLEKGTQIKSIFANKVISSEIYCPQNNRRLKSIATIYVAYATLFTNHPKTWDTKIMNKIISEGENHWKRSCLKRFRNSKGDFDILEYFEDKDVGISIEKLKEGKFDKSTNLFKIFTLVFQNYSNIIFQHKDICILIAKKTEKTFYIFDPNGRSFKCNREVDKGKASLITVESIEGLIYLIYYHSWKQYPAKYLNFIYRIYRIGLKRFCVINRYYAVITGTIGIKRPKYYDDENASIIIASIVLLYSYVDPAQHWQPRTINALIQYGQQYYSTLRKSRNLKNVQIKDLPSNLVLGAYSGHFTLIPYLESGFIENTSSYRRNPLRRALIEYFQNYNEAILQIDNTYLAIFKNEHFFYVFDPMERNKNGLPFEGKNRRGGAILQIHINFESMCKIIYMNALKIITKGYFHLHGCTIQKVNILTMNKYLKKKAGGDVGTNVPLECLSNLSINPCGRACSEFEFLQKQNMILQQREFDKALERSFSIKSIDKSERVATPDSEFRLCKEYDSDEENLSTNFMPLLNGTTIICGQQITVCNENSEEIHSMLLRGLTSAYGAIICSRKYKISTWNSDTVNCAMEIGDKIQSSFLYESEILPTLINNNFPEIQIGCHMYNSTVKVLGCCAVIRRRNKYYLFFGIPCDEFGFRTTFPKDCELGTTNKACILRFNTLKSCVDRISFGSCDKDVNIPPHQINILKEQMIIKDESARKTCKENYIQKQLENVEELKDLEIKRINTFKKLKNPKHVSFPNETDTNSYQERPLKKHAGEDIKETPPMYVQQVFNASNKELHQSVDNLFRICGNYSLMENDNDDSLDLVNVCHFASVCAILQAIITPIQEWNPQLIDTIIDKSKLTSLKDEKLSWITSGIPIWSRKNKCLDPTKFERGNMMKEYEIEILNDLYSLFGTIHPKSIIFKESHGKQYLAINVIACCIAHLFRVTEWNPHLLDSIVIHGNRYHNESFKDIKESDFEIEIEYLNKNFKMNEYNFDIGIKRCTYGILFCSTSYNFNLSKSILYFFKQNYRYGIIQIDKRCLAFGLADKGYFMYDCQYDGPPLFDMDQGASYCLLCNSLQRLIYCIIVTLNIRKNIEFLIYAI
ncbi:uncharacterized protein LOC129608374, partial [Condylostylus longicornis]|uniref:uncharacterized protein LOC129608374 n=1 Tax=Condylostylus longicornis TaxID=2530218 RepID=UPI00244D99FA